MLASALVLVALLAASSHQASMVDQFKTCQVESKATKEDIESFQRQEVPTSYTGKCLLACMFEATGLMKNHKFNMPGAMEVAQNAYKGKQDKMAIAKQVVETCSKEVAKTTDRCEIAAILAICTTAESEKLKL